MPPYLLTAARLVYGPGEPPIFSVGGFAKCPAAGPPGNYYGEITRGGKTLAIRLGVNIITNNLAVQLEGSEVFPGGDIAQSPANPITPGTAWSVTPNAWLPGEPIQHPSATIST